VHAGCSKVRILPAHPLSQTHRQDGLQYTAPQLASVQCNKTITMIGCNKLGKVEEKVDGLQYMYENHPLREIAALKGSVKEQNRFHNYETE